MEGRKHRRIRTQTGPAKEVSGKKVEVLRSDVGPSEGEMILRKSDEGPNEPFH